MRAVRLGLGTIAVVLGVCCAAGHVWIARVETVPRAAAPSDPPETRFVETRSGRVHVLDRGSGEVLLLVHGTGASVADWQEGLAERLARRHRVVAFDYYGHGLSDRDHGLAYGSALWARQAIDVMDALGVEHFHVIGHSVGGVVAAVVAADAPGRVRSAVFIGHGMAMDPVQIVPILPGVGEIAVARTALFRAAVSRRHGERLADAYAIEGTRAALLVYLRRQYTIDGIRLLRGTYEDIEAPVLQVHGSRDASIPVAAARGLTPRLRDARFLELEGVGHDVHIEATEQLARAIEAFLHETRG